MHRAGSVTRGRLPSPREGDPIETVARRSDKALRLCAYELIPVTCETSCSRFLGASSCLGVNGSNEIEVHSKAGRRRSARLAERLFSSIDSDAIDALLRDLRVSSTVF